MKDSVQQRKNRTAAMPIIAGVVAAFLLVIQALSVSHIHGDPDFHLDKDGHAAEECDLCFVLTHSSCDVPALIAINASAFPALFVEVTLTELWLPPANVHQGSRAPPAQQT